MVVLRRSLVAAAFLPALLLLVGTLGASQLEDNLSAYSEMNATGYMQPLGDIIGTNLNSGLWRSADIAGDGLRISLEVPAVMTRVRDKDRTFRATTEAGFFPEQTVDAPTAVGPSDAVIVEGEGGTQFAFPGGLDLNSLPLASVQLRLGRLYGTEVILRYVSANVSDEELGKVRLFGIGGQHSISQYLGNPLPFELSAGLFWQSYTLGENRAGRDLIKGSAFTIGAQGSKKFGQPMIFLEPYGGISVDTHSMEIDYESEATGEAEDVILKLDRSTNLRFTIGALFRIYYIGGYGDYSFTGRHTFSFGIIIGN